MKRAWFALPITLAIIAAAALTAGSQTKPPPLPIRDTVLANGLRVIVIENHAVPIVTVELDVKNGAYTETSEFDGLSHLYEHMFFKANRTIPSQEKYLERLRQLGAAWNGSTSTEQVNYFITLGRDSLVPGMQFMEDAVRYPLFDQAELERERPVVLGEFDRNEASPFFHLQRGVDTLLWTKKYYTRKNVMGDRGVIGETPQEKMQLIQSRYYLPNNTALILSGDVAPARGFKLATQVFGDWPRGADPFADAVPNPPPLAKSQAVIVERPVNAVSVLVSWQGPSVGVDPASTYAADVLSAVLANPASPFQKRLVDSGLTFGAGLSYYTQAHVGPISASFQTTPDKVLAAERALFEEIGKLADENYLTPQLLADAQKQLGIQAVYEREQSSGWAHTVGFWWCVAGLPYYREYVPNMQKVTRADIAHYAQTYIVKKPFVVGALISPAARLKIVLTTSALLPKEIVP
jgi:zinc protease